MFKWKLGFSTCGSTVRLENRNRQSTGFDFPRSWGGVRMAWMKRSFTVPSKWDSKRVILHFEAVMGEFVVMINGQKAAQHFGDYLPFEVDITDFVKKDQV